MPTQIEDPPCQEWATLFLVIIMSIGCDFFNNATGRETMDDNSTILSSLRGKLFFENAEHVFHLKSNSYK
jgi:hypothetical protein